MTPLVHEFVAPADWTEVVVPWSSLGIDGSDVMGILFVGAPPARVIAPFMPPYHLAQLALMPINGDTSHATLHVAALAGFTLLFLAAAVLAYRRDDGRTWG